MYAYLLSKENLKLAKHEALIASGSSLGRQEENVLFISRLGGVGRLAFTKKIYKVLFSAKEKKEFLSKLEKFNFNKIYSGSFSIRVLRFSKKQSIDEREIADYVWRAVKNPKVDLSNAKTKLRIICAKSAIYCCLLIWENAEEFMNRRSHLRPEAHPTSLSPKLARCLVNMANEKEITDPFCGAGGILMEAGLMGINARGYDLDENMLYRARINLRFFRLRNIPVFLGDATKLKRKTRAIVTDLPYGRGSWTSQSPTRLYREFLENLAKITKKAVVVFPDSTNYRLIIKSAGWKAEREFEYFIHKSLTKKILILSRQH